MLHTEEIEYRHEDLVFRGFLAYKKDDLQPKPCVMVVHDWSGRGENVCNKAIELANLGYVGFAPDMYGNAREGRTTEERRALVYPLLDNRKEVGRRINAALNTVRALPFVDKEKIASIGYCFGGLCSLDLARAGAAIKGAVSFHGILTAPEDSVCEKIRAKILVLHGYDDPLVLPAQVQQFAREMTHKKVDWQLHMYGLTQHSFTNPTANDPELGLLYNAEADHRSWASTEYFLKEIFK